MTGFAPFLAGIIADPASDDLRLVYADWLEEHGESDRAEYIRCAVELAIKEKSHLPFDDPCTCTKQGLPVRFDSIKRTNGLVELPPKEWDGFVYCNACLRRNKPIYSLRSRCDELLAAHRREWTMEGLPEEWSWCCEANNGTDSHLSVPTGDGLWSICFNFSRGFRSAITCRWEEFKPHNAVLRAAMPLTKCKLTTRPSDRWADQNSDRLGLTGIETWQEVFAAEFPGIEFELSQAELPTLREILRFEDLFSRRRRERS